MSPLNDLMQRLHEARFDAERFQRTGQRHREMQALADRLEKAFDGDDPRQQSNDKVLRSLQTFANDRRVRSLSQARSVCYAITRPFPGNEGGVLKNTRLFHVLLGDESGVGRWRDQPLAFRRCYRGLVSSYFEFYGMADGVSPAVRRNWREMRDYLHTHSSNIQSQKRNPRWVATVDQYLGLFADSPESVLANAAGDGNKKLLARVFEDLFVASDSWFRHRLLLAQVKASVGHKDGTFVRSVPKLLRAVTDSPLVRDAALALMLGRYMSCDDAPEHDGLRDAAVEWWGNPWLPSQKQHWGRVKKNVRDRVAQWLHKEFIEAFFRRFSSDNIGDTRRAEFWSRYLGLFSDMRFGLGPNILDSPDPDFVVLLDKMKGLYAKLESPASDQNAFIMTLGDLVVVEFSNASNALYAYDRHDVPFDLGKNLRMPVNAPNSLKNKSPVSVFKLMHVDGRGRWEDKFARRIEEYTGIRPNEQSDVQSRSKQKPRRRSGVASDKMVLQHLRREYGVESKDLRSKGGNLWILCDDRRAAVNEMLKGRGFSYRPEKGWWKSGSEGG